LLGDSYEITVDDVQGALKKQNLTIKAGDAVINWLGQALWQGQCALCEIMPRHRGESGGMADFPKSGAAWLRQLAVEVAPNPDRQISLPVHQIALVVNGVHLLENLKLDELVAKNVQEFAFIMTALKIRGATGSTVSPIAVR
jgi:hypothetical protein